jgi:hypothetical protein
LLHTRLRYFDAVERRPGLPPDVGALVYALDADGVNVTLTNSSVLHERRAILQAGAFGEHEFTNVQVLGGGEALQALSAPRFTVVLPPGRMLDLRISMRRYAHQPSYTQPAM